MRRHERGYLAAALSGGDATRLEPYAGSSSSPGLRSAARPQGWLAPPVSIRVSVTVKVKVKVKVRHLVDAR